MKNDRQTEARREKIIMVAASAFVMAALTLTGVYVRNRSAQEQDDGYSIDFSQLESGEDLALGDSKEDFGDLALGDMEGDDLDYDPMSEVDSNLVEIPGLTDRDAKDSTAGKTDGKTAGDKASDGKTADDKASGDKTASDKTTDSKTTGDKASDSKTTGDKTSDSKTTGDKTIGDKTASDKTSDNQASGDTPSANGTLGELASDGDAASDGLQGDLTAGEAGAQDLAALPEGAQEGLAEQPVEQTSARVLEFAEGQRLIRPTSGEVLMHYSMNGSIYFATLDQYKYNPAVMLAATEGDSVQACAEGQVIAIFQDEEIGQAVTLSLGNGYQATYGQLQNLTVELGGYVNGGDILGYVAAPTKYYVVEGTNLYFSLTKDGVPVNPEELFP